MLAAIPNRAAALAATSLLGAACALALWFSGPAPVPCQRITFPEIAAAELAPAVPVESGGVIAPPALRDARPWPEGMVIVPPSIDPGILIASPGWIERALTALLRPLAAFEL
ncbi:MAG TPA: hypothetical protein VLX92_18305 [Kofleriaceae bacterium]|nr:hypothetical protein [Kofleriaceae bacterium]